MEGVGPASTDRDHLDMLSGHVRESVFTQCSANVVAAAGRSHREDDDLTMAALRVDRPGKVSGDRSVVRLGDRDVLAGGRIMQRGDLGAVVIGPPAVLVTEDRLSHNGPEMVLVKRAELLDGQVGQSVEIARKVGPDVHGVAYAFLTAGSSEDPLPHRAASRSCAW